MNIYRHAEDEQNSLTQTALLMQTGGGTAEAGRGIHWHIESQENQCLACHFSTSIEPFPANHEGFSNPMCLSCHSLED